MVRGTCDGAKDGEKERLEKNYFVDQAIRSHDFLAALGSAGCIFCLQSPFQDVL